MKGQPFPTGTVADNILRAAGVQVYACFGSSRLNATMLHPCSPAFDERGRAIGHVFVSDGTADYEVNTFEQLCSVCVAHTIKGDTIMVQSMTHDAYKQHCKDMNVIPFPAEGTPRAEVG